MKHEIPGFNKYYMNEEGVIVHKRLGTHLKPCSMKGGYLVVFLYNDEGHQRTRYLTKLQREVLGWTK